jgi:hypothetical protein
LTFNGETLETKGQIVDNPLVKLTAQQHQAYDAFMTDAEVKLSDMHNMVNKLKGIQSQMATLVDDITDKALQAETKAVIAALDGWDKSMVQRMSKAYDDVENFPNMFTAEYIFMLNHANNSIPLVNEATKSRKAELEIIWNEKKKQADGWLATTLPELNEKLWKAGIGAIKVK